MWCQFFKIDRKKLRGGRYESPDGVAVDWWGETLNGYELLGLLEVAKQRTYEVNMTDGDD
jgi:hypothetical protein